MIGAAAGRAELDEAQRQAAHDDLRLGVEEITVELDVAYTVSVTGEASAGVKAKFWVLESLLIFGVDQGRHAEQFGRTLGVSSLINAKNQQALEIGEASAKAGTEWDRARTQRLTLTLRPRVEQAVTDGTGITKLTTRGLDVSGALAAGAYWWYGSNLRTTQMWRWEAAQGFGEWLVNVYSGLCLALSPNTLANGTSIVVGACSTTTAKYWHVETG